MAFRARVQFVNVKGDYRPEVLAIGGFNPDCQLWRIPAQEAVVGLLGGLWTLYIQGKRTQIELVVRKAGNGRDRLTTSAGDRPLLALPEYPMLHLRNSFLQESRSDHVKVTRVRSDSIRNENEPHEAVR